MVLYSSSWYDTIFAQVEGRISSLPRHQDICKPDIPSLRSKLEKPLRPLWVTQTSTLPHATPEFPGFHPVVLCTASRRVRGAEASEGGYIQGAADDHEAWSHGLTPPLFWNNKDELLGTNEGDLPTKIAELVSQDRGTDAVSTLIKPTSNLYVSASQNVDLTSFDMVISCTPEPLPHASLKAAGVGAYLHLRCQTGKLGSRDLRNQLPALHRLGLASKEEPAKTLLCCPTGKDLSVGTALAYLCLYADEDGTVHLQQARERRDMDKTFIKQRLSWITCSNAALNPSRATLQSVNSVLMSREPPAPDPGLPWLKDAARHDSHWNPLPHRDDRNRATASPRALAPPPRPVALFSRLPTSSPWSFARSLHSTLPSHPSGTVTGTATFAPTPLPNTLLYAEQGEFTTDTGLQFTARRKYVYQLVDAEGPGEPYVRVLFFDDAGRREDVGDGGEGVGGLFVEMGELGVREGGWEARNKERHLCGEDLYAASWKFCEEMVGGKEEGGDWWEVRYDVKGPRKDYVSTTRYERAGTRNVVFMS